MNAFYVPTKIYTGEAAFENLKVLVGVSVQGLKGGLARGVFGRVIKGVPR